MGGAGSFERTRRDAGRDFPETARAQARPIFRLARKAIEAVRPSARSIVEGVARGRSAIAAATAGIARAVSRHPSSAHFAPSGRGGGMRTLVEDFDLTGIDESLDEQLMLRAVRGDLSALFGA